VELEFQAETIGRWGIRQQGNSLYLTALQTACLAPDQCGVPVMEVVMEDLSVSNPNTCTPGGGCC